MPGRDSGFFLYQQAAKEISQRKAAEEKLRISEERYRHIYHKTPIMLHSIDTNEKLSGFPITGWTSWDMTGLR